MLPTAWHLCQQQRQLDESVHQVKDRLQHFEDSVGARLSLVENQVDRMQTGKSVKQYYIKQQESQLNQLAQSIASGFHAILTGPRSLHDWSALEQRLNQGASLAVNRLSSCRKEFRIQLPEMTPCSSPTSPTRSFITDIPQSQPGSLARTTDINTEEFCAEAEEECAHERDAHFEVTPYVVLIKSDGSEPEPYWLAITLPRDLALKHFPRQAKQLLTNELIVVYMKSPSIGIHDASAVYRLQADTGVLASKELETCSSWTSVCQPLIRGSIPTLYKWKGLRKLFMDLVERGIVE